MTYYVNSSSYPHSSVVYVEATFATGNVYSGTGVVVGQNDVLTASHVIYDVLEGGLATEITVTPALDGSTAPYGTYSADTVDYYTVDDDGDGYLSQTESQWDLALLGFDDALGNTTGWFGIDPTALSGNFFVTGYPGVYADASGPQMTEDYGYASLDWFTTTWNHWTLELNAGNSGGPLWHYVGGSPYVVGIVSTGGWSADVYGFYSDIISWIDGNDYLLATANIMTGSETAEAMAGTSDSEIISAGGGSDTIVGGAGEDILYGNKETDLLSGGAGNDTIYGGQNNGPESTGTGNASDGSSRQREGIETISGGAGDDVLYGNYGNDEIFGGDGNDYLFGGQDSDTLSGGAGDDHLYGNRGDDTMVGGSGSDTFVIQTNTVSSVTVNDFTVGEDFLQASGTRVSATDNASGTLIEFSNGSTVQLVGISSSQVTDSIFV